MPYAFHWLTLPDLQGSVKRGKGNSENMKCICRIFTVPFTTFPFTTFQWIHLDKLFKVMEFFFSYFELVFVFLAENWKLFKRIARHEYESKCNVLSINQWIRLDMPYKLMESFFSNFKNVFELLANNRKIFKQLQRCKYLLKCDVLYINKFISTRSANQWKAFFKFWTYFWVNYTF